MCFGGVSLFKNLSTFFSCLFTIFQKKLPPLKHILALPTWGQKSLISELQPYEKGNFDLVALYYNTHSSKLEFIGSKNVET